MNTVKKIPKKNTSAAIKKIKGKYNNNVLGQLAFTNSAQPNIISIPSKGKILTVNKACCKLLGYSKKELLTKSRADIFDINESSFKKMLQQRSAQGESVALVTAIKKNGKVLPCHITSAVFMDDDAIEKAITTITDMSQSILEQKNIDTKKEKTITDNIVQAKLKQKYIDIKKEKKVRGNRILVKKENFQWKKSMGKTSYDVMWDWDIATDKIYVGESVEEVFGYKLKNNIINFSDFSHKLLPSYEIKFKNKLLKSLASRSKSWNDAYIFKRQDGSAASTKSRAIIIRNEAGLATNLIGATMDVSILQELKNKPETQVASYENDNQKFLLASKLSFDVIWDWDLLTDEVFRGDGFYELLGYNKKNTKGHLIDWKNNLHPDDKGAVEKTLQAAIASTVNSWEHEFRFIKADGSIAFVLDRATILRHSNGKAYRMIGAIHDLTVQRKLEEKLKLEIAAKEISKESFKLMYNSSTDLLYDIDLLANNITLSDAYEKEFGYKITMGMTLENSWLSHIHSDDKKAVIKNHKKLLASNDTDWNYHYRFLRADNAIVNVKSSGIILRKADGKAYRMIGSLQDISKQKDLEKTLKHEIYLKEKQIEEAIQDARETQRADIGKELHDNINQLLGASKMYIEMAKRGGENSKMYLSRSSEYTLTAIEEIRKLSKGLVTDFIKNLGLCESIINLAHDTMEVYAIKILYMLEGFKEQEVNDKFKLTIYRIVQEQLNNILKHAKAKKVNINLAQNSRWIKLIITDDGIGFNTATEQKGIGMANIKSRAAAYNASAEFVSTKGNGCVLSVKFPFSGKMKKTAK